MVIKSQLVVFGYKLYSKITQTGPLIVGKISRVGGAHERDFADDSRTRARNFALIL